MVVFPLLRLVMGRFTHFAGKIVVMIVMMLVEPIRAGGLGTKQPNIFRILRNRFGLAGTTHMLVETHHPVAGTHHHMQVVGDQENAAAPHFSDIGDQW